jgi:predicted ArsR family transcriptional regulator
MRRVLPGAAPHLDTAALHQVDALVDDLIDAGFDPLVDEDELTVDLTPCAQAEAQSAHRSVLCRVHLGLMQSVLNEAGGPLSVDGMRPSCDPRECVVQLIHAAPAD